MRIRTIRHDDNVPGDYWSVLEANISVFCVCMVSFPALSKLRKLTEP